MTEAVIPTSMPGDIIRGMRTLRSDMMVRLMGRNPTLTLDELDPVLDRMMLDIVRAPEWWRGEEPDDGEDEDE